MKTISGKIFTVKIAVERPQEDGIVKKVKEEYAVSAVNFTDCEVKITKEVGSADNVKGSFEVLSESVAPIKEVYVFDEGDIFYKVKISEIYLDDYGRERKNNIYYLVNASDFEQARKNIETALSPFMSDYTIAAVVEQGILGVFE